MKPDERRAREEMSDAEMKPVRRFSRFRLYDKIKGKVSVGAMNIIIYTVAGLILLALIIGIATGGR